MKFLARSKRYITNATGSWLFTLHFSKCFFSSGVKALILLANFQRFYLKGSKYCIILWHNSCIMSIVQILNAKVNYPAKKTQEMTLRFMYDWWIHLHQTCICTCVATLVSCIFHCVLHPTCPGSVLSASVLSCITPVMHPYCPASVLGCLSCAA